MKRAPSWKMRDVTRKGFNKLILSPSFRVGSVAQWYGDLIEHQKDGGSSLGTGATPFLILFSFFQCFFVLFCLFVFFY